MFVLLKMAHIDDSVPVILSFSYCHYLSQPYTGIRTKVAVEGGTTTSQECEAVPRRARI